MVTFSCSEAVHLLQAVQAAAPSGTGECINGDHQIDATCVRSVGTMIASKFTSEKERALYDGVLYCVSQECNTAVGTGWLDTSCSHGMVGVGGNCNAVWDECVGDN
jgi:hypothetical protein